jgi:molecular chaperone DnaK (HSP70)
MTRQFPEKEYHIIYDAGASSIRASVVSFTPTAPAESPKSKSKTAREGTSIEVKGVGYNLHSGGTELDRRLRELLIEQFEKKHGKSIRKDERAMARLWKEAGRVKAILSANTDSSVAVSPITFVLNSNCLLMFRYAQTRLKVWHTTSTSNHASRVRYSRRRARISKSSLRNPFLTP